MSSGEPGPERGTRLLIAWAAGGALVLLVVFLYLMFGGSSPPPSQGKREDDRWQRDNNALKAAREALAKETDAGTCRSALLQVNTHLSRNPDQRPPAPGAPFFKKLQERFGLSGEELGEVEASSYTQLDAHHLDLCLLLRDAARSLEVQAPVAGGKVVRPAPLEQAEAAFAWVVRQVRLEGTPGPVVPPQFALRRGWGTALDRALVFLALLDQVGEGQGGPDLLGCLVFCPDKEGSSRLWACGVVAGDGRALHLFDPRLGMPLPGPKGKGVATLAEVGKDPEVLGQLTVSAKHPYDVTPDQARKAAVRLTRPLPALAPRMRVLQDRLLPPAVRVRLAADPDRDLKRLETAVAPPGGKGATVGVWQEGTGLLRNFLPKEDGGADDPSSSKAPFALRDLTGFTTADDPALVQMGQRQLYQLRMVPWAHFPPEFRDPRYFHFDVSLGRRVHDFFAEPFLAAAMKPGSGRDLLLRGRTLKAVSELTSEYSRWQRARQRLADARDLDKGLGEWVQRANHDYAELSRAQRSGNAEAVAQARRQVEALWKEADPVAVLIEGALAGPRGAEVVYQLGLCKHERAAHQQARLDLLRRVPGADPRPEQDKAQAAWRDALDWWKEYVEEHKRRPGYAAARRLRGQAQALAGDWRAAVASWEDLSEPLGDAEKVANLYQAAQLKK